MAFNNVIEWKTCFLKMPIHVAGKDECAPIKMLCNGAQQLESFVGYCFAI